MTYKIRYISAGALMVAVVVFAFSFFYIAKANPSYFIRSSNTSTSFPIATTTQAYMNAGGVATTTLTFDMGVSTPQAGDSAALLVQLSASTSQPVLDIDIQYSQDNIDWYAAPIAMDFQAFATSTPTLGTVQVLQLAYASSTISRTATQQNATTTTRIVNIKTPTRYVRGVFYTAPGSPAAAVWAEFVAKRQGN